MSKKSECYPMAVGQHSRATNSDLIVTKFDNAVKDNDLATILQIMELKPKLATRILQEVFPKFDQTLLSKCIYADSYGVVLHPIGYELLRLALPLGNKISKDMHRFRFRISARLPEDEYRDLLNYIAMDGCTTVQQWLRREVQNYISKARDFYG